MIVTAVRKTVTEASAPVRSPSSHPLTTARSLDSRRVVLCTKALRQRADGARAAQRHCSRRRIELPDKHGRIQRPRGELLQRRDGARSNSPRGLDRQRHHKNFVGDTDNTRRAPPLHDVRFTVCLCRSPADELTEYVAAKDAPDAIRSRRR